MAAKRKFVVYQGLETSVDDDKVFETVEDAVEEASRRANKHQTEYRVWEAVKVVKTETPPVVVVDI